MDRRRTSEAGLGGPLGPLGLVALVLVVLAGVRADVPPAVAGSAVCVIEAVWPAGRGQACEEPPARLVPVQDKGPPPAGSDAALDRARAEITEGLRRLLPELREYWDAALGRGAGAAWCGGRVPEPVIDVRVRRYDLGSGPAATTSGYTRLPRAGSGQPAIISLVVPVSPGIDQDMYLGGARVAAAHLFALHALHCLDGARSARTVAHDERTCRGQPGCAWDHRSALVGDCLAGAWASWNRPRRPGIVLEYALHPGARPAEWLERLEAFSRGHDSGQTTPDPLFCTGGR
jgi:hypothetical protein